MSLDELNPPQREAVLHGDGPLLILAGAGSGKTRVITHRLAELVSRGVRPWNILAVTFTNKAAGEMRERSAHLLGDETAKKLWIGTFHSVSSRLLRFHAASASLRPDFQIYDDDDQKRLVIRVMAEAGISDRAAAPRQILSRIDQAKNAGIRSEDFIAEDYLSELVSRVYPEYQRRLRAANAVDFGDLILEALRLCDHPEAGRDLGSRFRYVLVDEFQDTNHTQYALVKKLARSGNLCVVGDDDQAIYKWRGADVRNILDFDRDYPGCAVVKLEQNYRSTELILEAANGVISKNLVRKQKRLFTEIPGGEPIIYFTGSDERREAEFVVRAMRQLIASEQREPTAFAVLYRMHAQSRVIEEALRGENLPYTIYGGVRFFDRAEVKDLLGYLRVVGNPGDEISLLRIVNAPPRGIGDTTLAAVSEHARRSGLNLWESMRLLSSTEGGARSAGQRAEPLFGIAEVPAAELPAGAGLSTGPRKKLAAFVELIERLRKKSEERGPVSELAATALEWSGMRDRLSAEESGEAADRLANLDELINSIRDYEREAEEPSLVEYLERVSLVSSGDAKGKGVALMTVHAAKGLEFDVVFLAGLEEGTFPMIKGDDGREKIEEERRLCYVAITRARRRLVISNAANRRLFRSGEARVVGNTPLLDDLDPTSLRESRFIADIPESCIVRPVQPRRPSYGGYESRRIEARGDGVFVEREDEPEQSETRAGRPASLFRQRAEDDRSDGGGHGHGSVRVVYDEEHGAGDGEGAFRVGQKVRHATFGEGRVRSLSGGGAALKVVVDFVGYGQKTVVARFVQPA